MNSPRLLSFAAPAFGIALAVLASGCAVPADSGESSASGSAAADDIATVSGTATWRERMSLPPGAVFEATLEDVSPADARSVTVSRTRIVNPGQPPIRFVIPYDPSRVQPRDRHVVRARVMHDDELLFTTESAYPVSLTGLPQPVELLLRRVSATSAAQR